MNYGKDFNDYFTKHLGKGSLQLDYFSQRIENSMTPYILEEREMRVTQMEIDEGKVVVGCRTCG